MALFVYKQIPDEEIRKERESFIARAKAFFAENPRRRVCRVDAWYGDLAKIRRGHVEDDGDKTIGRALARNSKNLKS